MLRADRKYDLVLYGASGFTGRQTVEYCKQLAPPGFRWAIAGRNLAKLGEINSAGVDILVADAQDAEALNRLAAQTRAVASTAGPFSLYGTKLVDACVGNRTHYCDITGETPWIRGLIDRHHARAAADGTRIVPCCGFDSIPSDYGAWLTSRHMREVGKSDCVKMSASFRMGGGINGGTLASFFHLVETKQTAFVRDPFLLDPNPAAHSAEDRARNADPAKVLYNADLRSWTTAFLMGSINTRVVRRTQALLGTQFDYQEYTKFSSAAGARVAAGAGRMFQGILESSLGRRLAKPLLPKPGEGPSEKVMNDGFFKCEFVGTDQTGAQARGILQGQGDPGNRIAVKCLCESAFILALLDDPSVAAPGSGGVLTPVTALGDALVGRLAKVGITFEISGEHQRGTRPA